MNFMKKQLFSTKTLILAAVGIAILYWVLTYTSYEGFADYDFTDTQTIINNETKVTIPAKVFRDGALKGKTIKDVIVLTWDGKQYQPLITSSLNPMFSHLRKQINTSPTLINYMAGTSMIHLPEHKGTVRPPAMKLPLPASTFQNSGLTITNMKVTTTGIPLEIIPPTKKGAKPTSRAKVDANGKNIRIRIVYE